MACAAIRLRYESGTSRALLTVEQRFYTDWYPFRLVRVGGAIFADVGRTWGSGVIGNSDPGLLRDVGFGFRLGNTRSGLGNVLHIDFAFPLNNIAGHPEIPILGADHAKLLSPPVSSLCARLAPPRYQPQKADADGEIEHPPPELPGGVLVVRLGRAPAATCSVPLSLSCAAACAT